MYLGLSAVKNLACLLMLSSNGDQPRELLRLAMFRARVCEQITATLGWPDKSRSFAVGLISLFDVLLGEPMDTLLADLPVSPEIKAALLERTGQAGYVLAAVLALEKNEWGLVQQLGVDAEKLRALWMSAITWVDELDAQFVARAA
jgi:EAL and modified HD-GYP domain-containing signal transduction protein